MGGVVLTLLLLLQSRVEAILEKSPPCCGCSWELKSHKFLVVAVGITVLIIVLLCAFSLPSKRSV